MEKIKSYTDIEQSKKLAEFLPLESADMYYEKENNFKWMVYALLLLILYYVSKENVYIWFSGISAFMYGVGICNDIIKDASKYIKRKRK